MKFGGTSVGDASAFERVVQIVSGQATPPPVVIVSAMSGMTNSLLDSVRLAGELRLEEAVANLSPHLQRHIDVVNSLLTDEPDQMLGAIERARSEIADLLRQVPSENSNRAALKDAVLCYGEQLSSTLLAAVMRQRGMQAQQVDARQCLITDDQFGVAAPLFEVTAERSRAVLTTLVDRSIVPVLGGFIGATLQGETTTIGRGGSDYTAAIIGAVLAAGEIQIWTDVTGVLTADPRVVSAAKTIPRLSYAEAAELAYFGAKVLHPKTIHPAVEGCIPVRICNSSFPEEPGTIVGAESEMTRHTVKAIAHKTGVTTVQVTSGRMLGAYGFLRALFEVFERHRTIVDVVTTSEVSVSLA